LNGVRAGIVTSALAEVLEQREFLVVGVDPRTRR
jgi:hypothetical protein